jgi:7,8-dihydropterin-6-yl-methyl-4-(beta-D-ribofuranosyl)aminobenzene 5'-phosphate synthase
VHALLQAAGRPLPVATHADAFLPRYAVMGDGRVSPFYNQRFSADSVEASGGRLALNAGALDLGCGIRTTGVIPRENGFEGPRPPARPGAPGLYQVRADGSYGPDEVWDEQGLAVDVAGEGLVVLTGCAHAGVLNTVDQARRVCGDRPVRAVMGGFHLGFPTTPEDHVGRTVEGLAEREAALVMPMHCSGLPAHAAFSTREPHRYVQPAVGTRLRIPA